MINMLIIYLLAALTTGGAVVVSQYIGNKDRDNACNAASQLIGISSLISVGIVIFVAVFHKPMLSILFGNIEADVMTSAITYFVISGLSYPFLSIYDCGAALFRSMGNSSTPMIVSIIMNLINLVGNAIGIFVLHAGVAGVATASIIARAVAAAIMLYMCFNKKNEVFISFSKIFSWNGEMIRRILNIAIPNGIENGIFQLGKVLLISIVSMFGTASDCCKTNYKTSLVASDCNYVCANAINLAIVTVVGQCVGAGDYLQATNYTKKLMKSAYIGTILSSLGQILLLKWILNFYSLPIEVRHLTYILVMIHNCCAIFLWPASFTLANALRAAGDVRFTMVISISSLFIFRISFAYILGVLFFKWELLAYAIKLWGFDWMFSCHYIHYQV
ncbi:MAG: MATE family efflux transporter [Clostridium neonatale]